MNVLVIEDWWADRLRFENLLQQANIGIQLEFAWTAGRRGTIWPIEKVIAEADKFDRIFVDLAWTKEDEDRFRAVSEWADVSGVRLLEALSHKEKTGQLPAGFVASRCIVTSAYVHDEVRHHCVARWGTRTLHKWLDEDIILTTVFASRGA